MRKTRETVLDGGGHLLDPLVQGARADLPSSRSFSECSIALVQHTPFCAQRAGQANRRFMQQGTVVLSQTPGAWLSTLDCKFHFARPHRLWSFRARSLWPLALNAVANPLCLPLQMRLARIPQKPTNDTTRHLNKIGLVEGVGHHLREALQGIKHLRPGLAGTLTHPKLNPCHRMQMHS